MTSQWTAVTVTYNSVQHLRRHWADPSGRRDFRWVVVDNGSTDGTVEYARERADVVVETGRNAGFSAANNIGLQHADTDFVVFVNPDVTVDPVGWQEPLAAAVVESRGLVAPQLLNSDGSEQPNARGLPFLGAKVRNRVDNDSARAAAYARAGFDRRTYCAWAMGAALAGRASDFRRIGGWNESYFLYYEDHEIGLRAWRAGLPVVLEPAVRWTHAWQRETARPNVRAWRFELASMRTFYGAHPELLVGRSRSAASLGRLRRAGFGDLIDCLWQPAVAPAGAAPGQPGQTLLQAGP